MGTGKDRNFQHMVKEIRKNAQTVNLLQKGSAEFEEIENAVGEYETARKNGDEGISTMSQPLWYGNLLAKKAMAEHGITLQETYKPISKRHKATALQIGEGNHTRTTYDGAKGMEKQYLKNGKVIKRLGGNVKKKYVLANTRYENSKTAFCTNCGALCNKAESYNGCKYCGTPLNIKQKRNKIVSVESDVSAEWWCARVFRVILVIITVWGICSSVTSLAQDGLLAGGFSFGVIVYLLLTLAICLLFVGPILGIFLANFILVPMYIYYGRSNNRIEKIGFEMRKYDENFSHIEFYGLAQTYLKIWLLSKNKEELGGICDAENYVDNDIVDADCIRCDKMEISQDEKYHYIKLRLRVRYVRVDGEGKLKEGKKAFTIAMKRRLGAKSSLLSETFACPTCGSAVDILKNGKCGYCGEKSDLSDTNWVVVRCDACG